MHSVVAEPLDETSGADDIAAENRSADDIVAENILIVQEGSSFDVTNTILRAGAGPLDETSDADDIAAENRSADDIVAENILIVQEGSSFDVTNTIHSVIAGPVDETSGADDIATENIRPISQVNLSARPLDEGYAISQSKTRKSLRRIKKPRYFYKNNNC